MNRKELSQNHWKYYLMLEKRFVESIEFVELHEDNFDAFSNGYALLIQAIGAELDTVFKEFCGFNTTDRKTVADYAQYILTNTPDIKNQKISVQEYDIEIQPFMNWDITQPAPRITGLAIAHTRVPIIAPMIPPIVPPMAMLVAISVFP